jgi:hypothetical protein
MARRITRKYLKSPYARVMLYGQPGSGKTRTVGTASLDERSAPCLMLSSAGNPESISDYDPLPDIIEIEALKEYNPIYEWLAAGQDPNSPVVKEMDLRPPYKSLVVDGITETQRMSFQVVVGTTMTGPGSIPPTAEIQHFNKVLGQMVNFARLFFSLPMHVFITSLEREDRDQMTGAITYKPLLWGQSAGEVPGYALSVGRMVHRAKMDSKMKKAMSVAEDPVGENVTSVAFFLPSGKFQAKDQTGTLGDWMQNPTVAKMLDLIMAGT